MKQEKQVLLFKLFFWYLYTRKKQERERKKNNSTISKNIHSGKKQCFWPCPHWRLSCIFSRLFKSVFLEGNASLRRTSLTLNHLSAPGPTPVRLWTWMATQLFRQGMQLKPRENLSVMPWHALLAGKGCHRKLPVATYSSSNLMWFKLHAALCSQKMGTVGHWAAEVPLNW